MGGFNWNSWDIAQNPLSNHDRNAGIAGIGPHSINPYNRRALMFQQLPNLLTGGRLILAVVFFGMLSWYQYEGRGDPLYLNVAFVIYLVALVTDYLDGYIARKYSLESAFGRVVDPFVDKVLVLGSFTFFAGKNFIIPESGFVVKTITGVAPYMVVIMLARELLVTSLRGSAESSGQNFGAQFSGKLKMVFQSVTILIILTYVNYLGWLNKHSTLLYWATIFRDICIWLTVGITVLSGLLYVQRAVSMFRASKSAAMASGSASSSATRIPAASQPVGPSQS
jgi:CDP-diacylglycerol--glycerol-3-phosphate 3-phosphatidyltransferase